MVSDLRPWTMMGGPMDKGRRELEAEWRERLTHARMRYREKAAICAALMAERVQSPSAPIADPDGAFALQHALRLESAALAEYRWTLRLFTDLVVHGIVPRV